MHEGGREAGEGRLREERGKRGRREEGGGGGRRGEGRLFKEDYHILLNYCTSLHIASIHIQCLATQLHEFRYLVENYSMLLVP